MTPLLWPSFKSVPALSCSENACECETFGSRWECIPLARGKKKSKSGRKHCKRGALSSFSFTKVSKFKKKLHWKFSGFLLNLETELNQCVKERGFSYHLSVTLNASLTVEFLLLPPYQWAEPSLMAAFNVWKSLDVKFVIYSICKMSWTPLNIAERWILIWILQPGAISNE